jgi:hypothetical protein
MEPHGCSAHLIAIAAQMQRRHRPALLVGHDDRRLVRRYPSIAPLHQADHGWQQRVTPFGELIDGALFGSAATFVDAIVGYVLGPVAAMSDGTAAFTGFKRLFDVLFLLGTTAFGAGAMLALTNEMRSAAPIMSKPVALAGALAGLAGVLAAAACFAGFPLQQGVGVSVGLGSAVFVVIGVQIMLKSRQATR